MPTPKDVQKLIEDAGGNITSMGGLPDGSGFAVASFPLPKDHWLYADHDNEPPIPESEWNPAAREMIIRAARYAVRCATRNGRDMDFDPDALVQCMVVGMLGPRKLP